MISRRRPHAIPTGLATGTDWRNEAACLGHELSPEHWDDTFEGYREDFTERADRIARARRVCLTECPVLEACGNSLNLSDEPGQGVRAGQDLRRLRAGLRGEDGEAS